MVRAACHRVALYASCCSWHACNHTDARQTALCRPAIQHSGICLAISAHTRAAQALAVSIDTLQSQHDCESDAIGQQGCAKAVHHAEAWLAALWHFVAIILAATPLFALEDFVIDRFALAWRTHLTETITAAFFANEAYYRVVHMGGVDNPDQRITQDVDSFATSSTKVMNTLVSKAHTVAVDVLCISCVCL